MAIDTYLQIDGIKGESTDSQHKDWIDVLSYSGLTVPPASEPVKAADAKQTGASQHGHLVITKQVDRASPTLHEMCSSGKHIKQATIEVMRASGGKRVKYLVYELHEVIISNVSPQVSPTLRRLPAKWQRICRRRAFLSTMERSSGLIPSKNEQTVARPGMWPVI